MNTRRMAPAVLFLVFISCTALHATPQPSTGEEMEEPLSSNSPLQDSNIPTTPSPVLTRSHSGSVLALASGIKGFFSAGEDGFVIWHPTDGSTDAWQVSDLPVRMIAVHPDGKTIVLYESDGFSIHRISVWDWPTKTRRYAKRFRNSVLSVNWSAQGTWLFIGTSAIEGITVLDSKSGSQVPIFKSPTGLVNLSATGNSEATVVTFGPSGRIRYTDTRNGIQRAVYESIPNLSNPVLIHNNLRIAGFRSGQVYLLDATTGAVLQQYNSPNAILIPHTLDAEPQWLTWNQQTGSISLRQGNRVIIAGEITAGSSLTATTRFDTAIIVATDRGQIFRINPSAHSTDNTAIRAIPVLNRLYIDDVGSDGSQFFFLAAGSVYTSTGPGNPAILSFDQVVADRLTVTPDALLLWSSTKASPLLATSFDGNSRRILFNLDEPLRSVHSNNGVIAVVSVSSKITVIDKITGRQLFTYAAAGIQDAIPAIPGKLIVSKSASTTAPAPLIAIDIWSGETVALSMHGELAYGLQKNTGMATLVGFMVRTSENTVTELFELSLPDMNLRTARYRTVAAWADEDLSATLAVTGNSILTNLGKGPLAKIPLGTGNELRYSRGSALPKKIAVMEDVILTLNFDGSVSWYNPRNGRIISSASILADGTWAEHTY